MLWRGARWWWLKKNKVTKKIHSTRHNKSLAVLSKVEQLQHSLQAGSQRCLLGKRSYFESSSRENRTQIAELLAGGSSAVTHHWSPSLFLSLKKRSRLCGVRSWLSPACPNGSSELCALCSHPLIPFPCPGLGPAGPTLGPYSALVSPGTIQGGRVHPWSSLGRMLCWAQALLSGQAQAAASWSYLGLDVSDMAGMFLVLLCPFPLPGSVLSLSPARTKPVTPICQGLMQIPALGWELGQRLLAGGNPRPSIDVCSAFISAWHFLFPTLWSSAWNNWKAI